MTTAKTYFSAFALIVACAVIAFALRHLAGLTGVEASLTLACLLLGASQVIARMSRDTRADRTIAQVEDLALASAQSIREVEGLKQIVDGVNKTLKDTDTAKVAELASQIQVLETLVKQLAERVASGPVTIRETPSLVTNGAVSNGHDANGHVSHGQDTNGTGDPGVSDFEMIAKVRRSLEENRVDLYLQPVVSLPQRRTRYYEALTRLRDPGGDIIMPASYLQAAESAGIMPMIDNLLLFRCVKVMRRLVERNREIGVFCNISAHSLLDAEFFPQFLEFMKQNEELSSAMIFEFSQSTVNGAGPLELESMAMLRDLGFHFSMDHVTSLDIDYQSLANRGFRFLRVDARILIDGMNSAGAQIHSADLKALLGRFGLQLIAEKVETERDVVTLLDYDVGLGQGYLFSEPRLVREEIIDTPAVQAARSPAA